MTRKVFSMSKWKWYYQLINQFSRELNESYITPGLLSYEERGELKTKINFLTQSVKTYMDDCGITMPAPLWHYNVEDDTTWQSSDNFKFHDRKSYRCTHCAKEMTYG